MLTLETDRLTLRDFQPGDFEAFFQTSQDPEHQAFYSKRETTRAFSMGLFEKFLDSARQEERLKYQVAICLKRGDLIGTCGVRIEDQEHRQASFGIGIARAHWGKGLAWEASQQIINFGFSSLPIHRLYAETNRENKRVKSLVERLGMRLEGELRENKFFRGRWWDTAIYAILRPEWEAATRRSSGLSR